MELLFYQTLLLLYISIVFCYNIDENNYLMFDNGKTGSNFGFSSGLLNNDDGTWLLVGAPKDNFTDMPDVISPGNIYKCPVNVSKVYQSGCEEMVNLRSGERSRRNDSYSFEESNQLLGANLLVNNYRIVACTPLWKLVSYEFTSDSYLFGVGSCFEIGINLNTVQRKRMPTQLYNLIVGSGEFKYGMAQIGFAVSQVQENPVWDVLLGAPGMNDGKGGFVYFNTNTTGTNSYRMFSIKDEQNLRNTSKGATVGYSIGSGKFGTSPFPLVVIGSPRFSNQNEGHVGAVFILQDIPTLVNKKLITGDQTGSGFGTSLCVADINGDGKDDLLVGAPYYTYDIGRENVVECGKVHIYYGTGDSNYTTKYANISLSSLFGMRMTKGRFGLTMAAIGDINADSFTDVAIGAPYEDDMSGAIYIYNGRRGFISNIYSQRISGRNFVPMLKGFGMQMSAPLDVDTNQYPDFAVGAYLSDRAVILRTRPIVNMTVILSITPDVIPLNSSGLQCSVDETLPCVSIELCFDFQGKGVDEGILIDFDIKADTIRTQIRKSSRLQLSVGDKKYGADAEITKFRVVKGSNTCATIIGRVQTITKELYSSISEELRFEAEFSLSNESMPGRVFPILNEQFSRKINKSAYFEKECSGICRSNLVIEIETPDLEIVIKQTEQINIRVQVRNTDQPSYATTIFIQTSNNTAFLGSQENQGSRTISCKMAENNTMYQNAVQCEIDKPLYRHHFVDFQARFNVSIGELLPCERCYDGLLSYVTLLAVAETQGSIEVDESNNRKLLNIPIKFENTLDMNGISTPEQHKLSKDDEDYIEFVHEYTVYNNGPSPLPSTSFILDVPVQTPDKVKLIETPNIDLIPDSSSSKCRLISYVSDLELPSSTGATESTMPTSTETTTLSTSTLEPKQTVEPNRRKKRDAQSLEQPNNKKTITNITCETFGCAKYDCNLDHLDVEQKTSFKIRTSVKKSALPFGKNDFALRLKTKGEIQQPSHRLFYPWNRGVSYQAYIDFFPEKFSPQTKAIDIWIIIGGCLGGLALIIVLGIVLWRCGFFKRKQKTKEFQDWKRKSSVRNRRSQMSGSSKSSKWEPQEVAKLTRSNEKINGN